MLGLGVSLIILSFVPGTPRARGLPDRAVHTGAGLALVVWFVLPISRWLFGDLKVNFSIFLLGGLMIVIGATWAIIYNADILLGAVASTLGRIRALAPILRMSIAYPLRSLFRTGVTLAMFTLVVFTLVVGAITTSSFLHAIDNLQAFGGGFDIRATASPASPIVDMPEALRHARGVEPADFSRRLERLGPSGRGEPGRHRGEAGDLRRPRRRPRFPDEHDLQPRRAGEGLRLGRGRLAGGPRRTEPRGRRPVHRAPARELELRPDAGLPPDRLLPRGQGVQSRSVCTCRIRRPERRSRSTSSASSPTRRPSSWRASGHRSPRSPRCSATALLRPRTSFTLRQGVDPKAEAQALESAFLANGMQADSLQKLLDDVVAGSLTFDRLIMGFMGLGLIVGVAALGVISARSVVERRQQIGVLRAIGFRKRMVQACFLLESSFIALTSIFIGTALGVVVGHNIISDSRRTPSWAGMDFVVPWPTFAIVFLVVYAVALATTFLPALRASRVYPAEALRYQ